MKINELQLQNILDFNCGMSDHNAKLFINTNNELMDEIIYYLTNSKEKKSINLILDVRNIDFSSFIEVYNTIPYDLNKKTITKLLYKNLIFTELLQQLFSKIDLKQDYIIEKSKNDLEKSKKNTKIKDFKDIDTSGIVSEVNFDMIMGHINYDITINVFINNNFDNILFQSILNSLLDDRNKYHTRFYVEGDCIGTYYTSNGILQQETHDYHTSDLSNIKSINEKVKSIHHKKIEH